MNDQRSSDATATNCKNKSMKIHFEVNCPFTAKEKVKDMPSFHSLNFWVTLNNLSNETFVSKKVWPKFFTGFVPFWPKAEELEFLHRNSRLFPWVNWRNHEMVRMVLKLVLRDFPYHFYLLPRAHWSPFFVASFWDCSWWRCSRTEARAATELLIGEMLSLASFPSLHATLQFRFSYSQRSARKAWAKSWKVWVFWPH